MTSPSGQAAHVPVMLAEVTRALAPVDGGIYVDGTLGAGGHASAILDAARCTLWAIDRDGDAIGRGEALADHYDGRLRLIHGCFGDMASLLEAHVAGVDGVVLDLGTSSVQLGDAARGFSFQLDGPLDMRFSRSGVTAAEVVNTKPERELTKIIFRLGGERHARRIARAITAARDEAPIEGTARLAEIVSGAVPKAGTPRSGAIHPATRTFQALRIFVNDEIGELRRGLHGAEEVLAEGGRLCVVSFHSLEDREVKRFFSARAGRAPRPSRHAPPREGPPPSFRRASRALRPSSAEVAANPRARSARMRLAERTGAPAWDLEQAA